jgi:hypothetical protein
MHDIDRNWTMDRIRGGLSSGEGMVYQVRDPVYRRQPIKDGKRTTSYEEIVDDPGEEDKRCLFLEQEFSAVLAAMAREGNNLSQRLREAFDGESLGSLTKNSQTRCREPHISIIGHITPEELRQFFTGIQMANGFGNRFLWFPAKKSKDLSLGGRYTPDPNHIQQLGAASTFAANFGETGLDDEAIALWKDLYPKLNSPPPGLTGSMLARGPALVRRLASLYALLDCTGDVRPEHLHAAQALWTYNEASVRYLFGNAFSQNARRVLAWIRRKRDGVFTERVLKSDLRGRFPDGAGIVEALSEIERAGFIRLVPEQKTRPGPKASPSYEVHPDAVAAHADYAHYTD